MTSCIPSVFFRWRSPRTKEICCPGQSPGPFGVVRTQVRGCAAGWAVGLSRRCSLLMSLYSGLKCFVSKPSLIEGCFSCTSETQALTHWGFAEWKQQQPHLGAWLQHTTCSTKAPEELCHDIMRRNNRIPANLFNKLSDTFQHWPAVWAELLLATARVLWMHLRAKVATQWPLVCVQENWVVHKEKPQ